MEKKELSVSSLALFSSQYGATQSNSYVAKNVVSGSRSYPEYGDFTDAAVFVSLHNTVFPSLAHIFMMGFPLKV